MTHSHPFGLEGSGNGVQCFDGGGAIEVRGNVGWGDIWPPGAGGREGELPAHPLTKSTCRENYE